MKHFVRKDNVFEPTDNKAHLISQELINDVLSIYNEQHRYIKSFCYHDDRCSAKVLIDSYPYTKKTLFSYVTGPSLTLVVGQVAYVFAAKKILDNNDITKDISYPIYKQMRDDGNLVFTDIDFKFRKKIPTTNNFDLNMQIIAVKRMPDFIYARFIFSVDGYLKGRTNILMGPLSVYGLK